MIRETMVHVFAGKSKGFVNLVVKLLNLQNFSVQICRCVLKFCQFDNISIRTCLLLTGTQKETTSQSVLYLVILSSKHTLFLSV